MLMESHEQRFTLPGSEPPSLDRPGVDEAESKESYWLQSARDSLAITDG
jgi:hypothetical protein